LSAQSVEKVAFAAFSSFTVQACSPQTCRKGIIFKFAYMQNVHAAQNDGIII